jgi:hypothetical protein
MPPLEKERGMSFVLWQVLRLLPKPLLLVLFFFLLVARA